jgi:DNA repair protein RadC
MKQRFILFKRAGVYYSEDTVTRKQHSLRTKDEAEALTLLHSKNEAHRQAANYWELHVKRNPYFNPEVECFVVLILNTRLRIRGHNLISMGTLDTLLVHPREVFRLAVLSSAAAIVLMHNHPSGESAPSEADIKVTRDLIRAGQLLKVEVLDHVIMGTRNHTSLRELGYFL